MAKETFKRDKPHLNIGTIGHVDHGKTTLTAAISSVLASQGLAETRDFSSIDNAPEEKERGITVKAQSASMFYEYNGTMYLLNLIDTPGHVDFSAEVERALAVLDGAVLVVSGVDGVQAQTYTIWEALREKNIPTVIFINKLDRAGASFDRVVKDIASNLDALSQFLKENKKGRVSPSFNQ